MWSVKSPFTPRSCKQPPRFQPLISTNNLPLVIKSKAFALLDNALACFLERSPKDVAMDKALSRNHCNILMVSSCFLVCVTPILIAPIHIFIFIVPLLFASSRLESEDPTSSNSDSEESFDLSSSSSLLLYLAFLSIPFLVDETCLCN